MAILTGRVAVVTGGTGALGQAVALRLLADGAIVAVPYAVEEERERLTQRIAAADRQRLIVQPADVIDLKAMTAFAESVVAARGKIDILVAGVGGFAGGSLVETDLDTWTRMLDLNLTSAFSAAKAVVPAMVRARYGRVVVVASRAVVPPAGRLHRLYGRQGRRDRVHSGAVPGDARARHHGERGAAEHHGYPREPRGDARQ